MKEIVLFNDGWKFKKEEEIVTSVTEDYFDMYRSNTKTGIMGGPKSMSFYDEDWQTVNLPHDWVIDELPSKEFSSSQGNRPQGVAWYRKHFRLDEKYKDKKIFVKFDGISITSEVYLNNIKIAVSDGGYTPIFADITDFVFFDRNNTISVRADNTSKEGWWYEGGGIYRNSYIIIKENSYFADDGVFVTTKNNNNGSWTVNVESETVNADDCKIVTEFMGIKYTTSFEVTNPLLWSAESPNLYEIKVKLLKNDVICDEEIIRFGFREILFDKDNGFFINGKKEKIKGVCLHHDHAGVGVAVDKNILRYRLKKLKEMGCNAIRTSHNPQSPEFYEVADELGFYIMNEIRHFSSTEICLEELSLFVKRDRNHPSVIMWSLFNEEPLQCSTTGEKIIKTMIDTLHRFDTTRPVTGGMNGPLEISGVVKYTDVVGFNYLQYGYDEFHKLYPNIPLIGSETGSYLSTRDEYTSIKETSHVSCFEKVLWRNLYPWSDTPGGTWKYIMERPFVSGGFYWTGFDYYGETGPFGWPGITSNFGAMDICGFEKDCYFWHKALWSNKHVLEIPRPWFGTDGEILDIICYSNCDTVELFVNGKSLGEKKNNVFSPEIHKIPYEKGTLKAIGKINGEIVTEKEFRSFSNKRILEILPSEKEIGTSDCVIFDVFLKDEYNQIVKNEDKEVRITVENGYLCGSANGDNSNLRKNNSDVQPLFHGCAQFIVRPIQKGEIRTVTTYEDIKSECSVKVYEAKTHSINAEKFVSYANHHMMSDVCENYPDTKDIVRGLFTWIPTMIGVPKSLMMSGKKGFAVISNTVDVPKIMPDKKKLVIEKIAGDFDVYLGEKKIYSSNDFYKGNIEIQIDDFKENINPVCVLFKLNGEDCGISGNIYIEFE